MNLTLIWTWFVDFSFHAAHYITFIHITWSGANVFSIVRRFLDEIKVNGTKSYIWIKSDKYFNIFFLSMFFLWIQLMLCFLMYMCVWMKTKGKLISTDVFYPLRDFIKAKCPSEDETHWLFYGYNLLEYRLFLIKPY